MSSRELKTSKFSFVLRSHENSDVFDTLELDEIYLLFISESKYPLYRCADTFDTLEDRLACGL